MSNTSAKATKKTKDTKTYLGTQPTGKLLLSFAIPAIIAFLISAFYNIVDQIFIGHTVGVIGNAATNVVFPLFIISVGLSLLIGVGTSARFNLLQGEKNDEDAKDTMGNGFTLLIILGVVLSIVTSIFCKPLLHLFGASPNIMDLSYTYMRIICLGLPLLIFSSGAAHLLRADSSPKQAMIESTSGAIINIALDYLFIYVFHWGIAGAAWATLIGYGFSTAYALYYFWRHFQSYTLSFTNFIPKFRIFKYTVVYGLSPLASHIAMFVVSVFLNNALMHYGTASSYGPDIPLAVSGIIGKTNFVFMAIALGIIQGGQPVIGYNFGAGHFDRVINIFKQIVLSVATVGVLGFIILQSFPHAITSIYGTGSKEYFDFAAQYIHIFLFFIFINVFEPVCGNFYLSTGRPLVGIIVNVVRRILLFLPFVFFFPRLWGIQGILWSAFASDAIAGVVIVILLVYAFRDLTRRRNKQLMHNKAETN